MKNDLRIVFMGTPEFAVEPLNAMLTAGYKVLAVVTAPDKPAGRGQKMRFSPVKEFAIINGLPVLQPINLKAEAFLSDLRQFGANLQVVIAFRMLPDIVWQMPELGTINIHASLLPQYRGAAPINHAIINGETITGLTSFFIEKEIDTGKIIRFRKVSIDEEDDAGTLHDKLKSEACPLLIETLSSIELGDIASVTQDSFISNETNLSIAPKINKDDCRIDWHQSCVSIHNFIRGLSPFPGSFTNFKDGNGISHNLKIYKSNYILNKTDIIPGTVLTDYRTYLDVAVKDGIVRLKQVQLEGKSRMYVPDFLNGFNMRGRSFSVGT